MLQWVLFAERPLTLLKFQATIEINCSSYPSEDKLLKDIQRLEVLKRRVTHRSWGLLEFKPVAPLPYKNEDMSESEDRGTVVQLIH